MSDYDTDSWMNEIRVALKRDDSWRKEAEAAEGAYTAGSDNTEAEVPAFNIHHANVETIVPATYNSTPVPDIRAKQKGNPVDAAVASILEAAIGAQIDDNALDSEIELAAIDTYSTGRGVVRVAFEADEVEAERIVDDGLGNAEIQAVTQLANERVCYKVVSWRDYVEGSASRFGDVPWVAFRHHMTDEAMDEKGFEAEDTGATETLDDERDDELTVVWEVWCKKTRKVYFIRENDGAELKALDDPLGLSGFFPVPKPMQPIEIASKRLPICPYSIYRQQAIELDKVTRRIKAILSGIQVKGIVVSSAADLERLAQAGDNELVPIQDVESFAHTGGLDKAIVWWPFEKAITVLRELYIARDQIKQLIYEITGISDIVRGASKTSETATAQQIKTQWGSLRVKKLQRLIERHVRDLFVLTAEVIAANFSAQRIQEITGMQMDENIQIALDNGIQQYRVDIESDSTVRADLSRMKGEMEGFLNGTAAFFGTMGPIVQQTPTMAQPVMQLYQAFANQFNLGKQAQEALEQMGQIAGQAQQQGPSPEQQAAQAEMQAKMQAEQQRAQMDMARLQLDTEAKRAEMQLRQAELASAQGAKAAEAQIKQAEVQIKQAEVEIKQAELRLKEADLVIKAQQAQEEIDMERDQRRAVKIGNE